MRPHGDGAVPAGAVPAGVVPMSTVPSSAMPAGAMPWRGRRRAVRREDARGEQVLCLPQRLGCLSCGPPALLTAEAPLLQSNCLTLQPLSI